MDKVLEICVDDPAGVDAAIAGGADRIELCSALCAGGLTPSSALVALAVKGPVPVHAMVRPRPGDFHYDAAEIALMCDDIARLAAVGVAGIVIGITRADGTIGRAGLAQLRRVAPQCRATLHRAIDLTPDPCEAIKDAVAAGMDFVLSSGGAATAAAGADTLARMVAVAGSRLTVIGASGVTAENARSIMRATGLSQLHASASLASAWPDSRIETFGFAAGPERRTSPAKVAALKAAMLKA